jgi:hypothetical protein
MSYPSNLQGITYVLCREGLRVAKRPWEITRSKIGDVDYARTSHLFFSLLYEPPPWPRIPMDKHTFQVPFQHRKSRYIPLLALLIPLACLSYLSLDFSRTRPSQRLVRVPRNAAQLIDKCVSLNIVPAPPLDFHERNVSDRYDPVLAPKKPILIRNATIWTGEVAEGLEIVFGDILLDKGVIRSVGSTGYAISEDVEEINVNGAWVTPGLVDLHSHIGVNSAPILSGSSDTNSHEGIAQPWLRSLDGLNTYDESYELSRAGGVTTALILPGSDNAIGAFSSYI